MESMGDRIRQLREAKGLSQAELGRRLDVGRAAVNKWENGETSNIENATFLLLCVELGTDPAYLVWGADRWPEKGPPPPEDTAASGRFRIGGKRRT
jgi:transcriptional regulator with XRE-family HTH domain